MRQSSVCKNVQVFHLNWLENMLKQDSKAFVKLEDFYKLEKQYQKLLKRYVYMSRYK
jgi:hypothetical protein